MFCDYPLRIVVKNLQTSICIGIHPHEKEKQRVIVNVEVAGDFTLHPHAIEDCMDYELIHDFVVHQWPNLPHTYFLEQKTFDLIAYLFDKDARVMCVKASVAKPDVFAEAESVGVEIALTREEFTRLR